MFQPKVLKTFVILALVCTCFGLLVSHNAQAANGQPRLIEPLVSEVPTLRAIRPLPNALASLNLEKFPTIPFSGWPETNQVAFHQGSVSVVEPHSIRFWVRQQGFSKFLKRPQWLYYHLEFNCYEVRPVSMEFYRTQRNNQIVDAQNHCDH